MTNEDLISHTMGEKAMRPGRMVWGAIIVLGLGLTSAIISVIGTKTHFIKPPSVYSIFRHTKQVRRLVWIMIGGFFTL